METKFLLVCQPQDFSCPHNTIVASLQAKAIEEDERKAASKYGNMKKKQSDVMRKRMMGVRLFDYNIHAN